MIRFLSGISVHIFELNLVHYYENKKTIYTLFVVVLWTVSELFPILYLFLQHHKNFRSFSAGKEDYKMIEGDDTTVLNDQTIQDSGYWEEIDSNMDSLLTARAAKVEFTETSSFDKSYAIARRSTFGLMNQNHVKNSLNLSQNRPLEEIREEITSKSFM